MLIPIEHVTDKIEKKEKEEVIVVGEGLSLREDAAYRTHMRANEQPLSPKTQAELFELYIHGFSCEEILRLNRSKGFRLGAIVRACKEGEWYSKRAEYITSLLTNVADRVRQVQSESVMFIANTLAVAHKQYDEQHKLYLQTGDREYLKDSLAITNLAQYFKVAEMLLRLTGQDNNKTVKNEHKVDIRASIDNRQVDPNSILATPLSQESAARFLMGLQTPAKEEDLDDE